MAMKTTSDIIHRIAEYEQSGFTKDQAIELIKVERLIILNNEIKEMIDTIRHMKNERM